MCYKNYCKVHTICNNASETNFRLQSVLSNVAVTNNKILYKKNTNAISMLQNILFTKLCNHPSSSC